MARAKERGEFVISVHCAVGIGDPVWVGCVRRGKKIIDVTEADSERAAWEWCEAEARRRG